MAKKSVRKTKHVPQRTCVGCRQVLPKRTMTRIVRTPDGARVDPTGKLPGRGAYLHDQRGCWERAIKGALAHALKVEITELDREMLRAYSAGFPEEAPEAHTAQADGMALLDEESGPGWKQTEPMDNGR